MTTDAVPVHLSASTDGRPILIVATTNAGTDLHVATAEATEFDEVSLWASNTDATDRKLTVQIGGTGAGDIIEQTIPAEGGAVFLGTWRVNGGITIDAFAALTNVVNVWGTVNRLAVS